MQVLSPSMMLTKLGWRKTPYCQAIEECYEAKDPLYLSVPTKFAGTALEQTNVVTHPLQYDTLIYGISSQVGLYNNADNGQQALLKITHSATGLSWNSSAPLDASPVTALAGVCNTIPGINVPSPILPLPEAFFLPAKTWLTHAWQNCATIDQPPTGGSITYIGVQLTRPKCGKRPTEVTMPDGSVIPIGSRLPWFFTVGVGQESISSSYPGGIRYALVQGNKYLNYSEPDGCDIELQAVSGNFFNQQGVNVGSGIQIKITDMGEPRYWNLEQADYNAVLGSYTHGAPNGPLVMPYLLKASHRMKISIIDDRTGSVDDIFQPYVTFSGVRRSCEGIY